MDAREAADHAPTFDLPDDVLRVLPSDPYDQLDVARKITSIALTARVTELESESSLLRSQLADRDRIIADLGSQVASLQASLAQTSDKLARTDRDKEELLTENVSLSETVKNLSRDVAKLDVFKRTLMQSLQEDDESTAKVHESPRTAGKIQIIAKPTPSEDDGSLPLSRSSSFHSRLSEVANSEADDPVKEEVSRPGISRGLLSASETSICWQTPPETPRSLSLSVSPSRDSKPASPRWHSVSFPTSKDTFVRSSSCSALSSISHSVSGLETETNKGKVQVNGRKFLRQVRNRLPYEQFAAFLANIKELNSHKQTKQETLQKVAEIFGQDNRDLHDIFERFINRRNG